MIAWRQGWVDSVLRARGGAVEIEVRLDAWTPPGVLAPPDPTPRVRALAYPALVGEPEAGDRVLLNVAALERGLGTGGFALVVALPDRLPADPAALARGRDGRRVRDGLGHLVKARYTPLQAMVLGVDEQESAHHEVLRDADDLGGLPVVAADLHSSLPAVVAGARLAAARAGRPAPRVVYVMTDGGALPAWFSTTVAALREAGWLDACITVGQAFGGDLEAVTVHTGLLAARLVCAADLAVVAQGPGNLGTGTRWGFSGVAVGEAINAAGVLGGRPVAALRVSGADARERHRGVSHHSLTALGRVALVPADVAVPRFADAALAALGADVARAARALGAPAGRHRLVEVEAGDELRSALEAAPVAMSTMGRSLAEDPAAFLAAGAAGVLAGSGGS